jgi:hypothetical protein
MVPPRAPSFGQWYRAQLVPASGRVNRPPACDRIVDSELFDNLTPGSGLT